MLYSYVFHIHPYIFQSNKAHATPCEAFIGFFKIWGGTYATRRGAFIGFFKF